MPSWPEARAALTGLGLLLRFDAAFVNWFDRSAAGARRSFGLMLPLLPLSALHLFAEADAAADAATWRLAASFLVYYLLGWVMFPLTLIMIGRAIGREAQAIGAIGPYNWFMTARALAALFLTLLAQVEPLGETVDLLFTLLIVASLVYEGYLLNTLMGTGYVGAGLLAVIDYVLGLSLFVLLLSPVIVLPTS
jgi:hypothetical protein